MISLNETRINENHILFYEKETIINTKTQHFTEEVGIKVVMIDDKILHIPYSSETIRDAALVNLDKFLNISCCN